MTIQDKTTLAGLTVSLSEVNRERAFTFHPDEAVRAEMAKTVGVVGLPAFQAALKVSPWFDGVEINGRWDGRVVQTCGVSLDLFETPLKGGFTVRALPKGSPNMPEVGSEIDLDPDEEDAPDVLDGHSVDLGAYIIEHLNLEIDPFPRKPGAVFEPPQSGEIISPFASLRDLKS